MVISHTLRTVSAQILSKMVHTDISGHDLKGNQKLLLAGTAETIKSLFYAIQSIGFEWTQQHDQIWRRGQQVITASGS